MRAYGSRTGCLAIGGPSHVTTHLFPITCQYMSRPTDLSSCHAKPEPATGLLSLCLRSSKFNSRSAIRTLDIDGNEILLTNCAATGNKRELTAITKGQPYFSSLPTMCMIIARHIFCGLLKLIVSDRNMVGALQPIFSLSYTRKLICEIIGL